MGFGARSPFKLPSNTGGSDIFLQHLTESWLLLDGLSEGAWNPAGPLPTFVARGAATINDYTASSADCVVVPGSCRVLDEFDGGHRGEDHLPVVATLVITGAAGSQPSPQSSPYDRHAHSKPHQAQLFANLVRACPFAPACVEPSSHVALIHAYLLRAATHAFPKRHGPRPRETYLADVTFEQVLARGRLRAESRRLNRCLSRMIRRRCCAEIFDAWARPDQRRLQPPPLRGDSLSTLAADLIFTIRLERAQSIIVHKGLDQDHASFMNLLGDRIALADASGHLPSVFRAIRPLTKPATRSNPVVTKADGTFTTTVADTKRAFAEHFASALDATEHQPADFAGIFVDSLAAPSADRGPIAWGLVPSVAHWHTQFARMKPMTGMSSDKIGPELCRIAAEPLSVHLYCVGLKAVSSIAPPLQWRGGKIFELWKGKGSMSSLGSYRDITCCSALGKPFSLALRSAALSVLGAMASPGQTGSGLGGGGTDIARLWADAAAQAAQLQRTSVAILFIDVAAAFASVLRELVLHVPSSADQLAHRLLSRGFSLEDVRHCLAATQAHELWTQHGDHRHLESLLAEMHTYSWYTTDMVPECWCTRSGALAGSSLGDLIFLLVFSRVTAKARAELISQGLVAAMPVDPQPAFLPHHPATLPDVVLLETIEYMDDVAVPILAEAGALPDAVGSAAAVFQRTFSSFGLSVNWSKGKSEAILHFRGGGAKLAQQDMHYNRGSTINFVASGRALSLQVVRNYRHLGSRVDLAASLHADLSAKLAVMRSGVSALKGAFFFQKNRALRPALRPPLPVHAFSQKAFMRRGHGLT